MSPTKKIQGAHFREKFSETDVNATQKLNDINVNKAGATKRRRD